MWLTTLFSGFSWSKLLSGFAFWKGEKLGKLIFYTILFALAFGIYHKVFYQKTTVTQYRTIIQQADNVTMESPKQVEKKDTAIFLGLKLWRLKAGIQLN